MKMADDFNVDVLRAFRRVQIEIAAGIGAPPRIAHDPYWKATDHGHVRYLTARWFVAGKNVGLSIAESGRNAVGAAPAVPRRWTVTATGYGLLVSLEAVFASPPPLDIIREMARSVGLIEAAPVE